MTSRAIFDPSVYSARELLRFILNSPDAFCAGRRNNDLVNWFIARRLLDLAEGREVPADVAAYISEFESTMDCMTESQRHSLEIWDEDWKRKLRTLAAHYGHLTLPASLQYYWLPMDYDDGVHPGQSTLTDL